MFLQASVILLTGGGSASGGCAWSGGHLLGGVPGPTRVLLQEVPGPGGGVCPWRCLVETPPVQPLLRAVRIILECILVEFIQFLLDSHRAIAVHGKCLMYHPWKLTMSLRVSVWTSHYLYRIRPHTLLFPRAMRRCRSLWTRCYEIVFPPQRTLQSLDRQTSRQLQQISKCEEFQFSFTRDEI